LKDVINSRELEKYVYIHISIIRREKLKNL